ncbi:MAG: prephenate dehydrogenase [Candidatus Omnitrophota bacterium]|nr:prephenate dehydrogenase [Candidatus Omnitrophota bacterium]MBU1928968.1 prephenate dehydrogenase [Candidatus Omnitrophota bacterium]MBU2035725.1 prephenate dehydrogenase [Candidatus Omnitrophota bacterium]MBU2221287.1 prephenate dehydrogenase [Candidatus Omnitrophota bacterium]MBU2257626.1 prephenate dehydrogenase [Candidatus Omnitrophota bacterium]
MIKFNKVAVIGIGLIGGSIAQSLKKKNLAKKIVGISLHKSTILIAKRKRIFDECSQDLDIVKGADLVILATPVDTIIKLAPRIAALIPANCLVTDVGSTKNVIVSKLSKIFPNFIGSHPLAGSEKRGIINSDSSLFLGSLCIITPLRNTPKQSLARIIRLWRKVGTRTLILSAQEHDRILSYVSHLPHITAFALMMSIPKEYLKFSAGSLRDTTRIAASPSNIWLSIFLSNKQEVLKRIRLFSRNLDALKQAILDNNTGRIKKMLESARQKREALK